MQHLFRPFRQKRFHCCSKAFEKSKIILPLFMHRSVVFHNSVLILFSLIACAYVTQAQENVTLISSSSSTTTSSTAAEESVNLPLFTPSPAGGVDTGKVIDHWSFDDIAVTASLPPPSPSSAPSAADEFIVRYNDLVVQTTSGLLRGSRQISQGRSLVQFLGVPYAQPPVGDLRFMPPQPFVLASLPFPVNIPLDCWRYRPACPSAIDGSSWFQPLRYPNQQQFFFQNRDHSTFQPNYDPTQSEDCLHLNIFIPSSHGGPFSDGSPPPLQLDDATKRRKFLLPVLVILHGGWWHAGSAVWLGGAHLAVKGNFIVVTVNYRLGALGFLFNGIELPHDNLGLRDQNLALRWIRENIESFGGDPFRITVSGFEEAGATSVAAQIVTPPVPPGLNFPTFLGPPNVPPPLPLPPPPQLFQRAILLSGIDYHGQVVHDSRAQQLSGVSSLLDFVGCRGGSVEALRCLQRVLVDDILRWQALMSSRIVLGPVYNTPFLPFNSIIDGAIQRRNAGFPQVEMIVGFNDVLPLTQSGLLPLGDMLIQSGLAQAPQFGQGFTDQEWRENILPFLIQLLIGRPASPAAEALSFAYTFNPLGPASGVPPSGYPPPPYTLLSAPPPPPFPTVFFDPATRKIINTPVGPPFSFIAPPRPQQRTVPGDDAGIERDHALANLQMLEKFVSDAIVGVPTHRLVQSILPQIPPESSLTHPFAVGSPPLFYYYWTYSSRANANNIDARRDRQLDRFAFEGVQTFRQPPQLPSQGDVRGVFPFGDDALFFLFDPEHIQSESDAIVSKVWTDAVRGFVWTGNPSPIDTTPDEFYPPDNNQQQWLPSDVPQPFYLYVANSFKFVNLNKGVQIQAVSGIPREREFSFWDRVVQEPFRTPRLSAAPSLEPSPCCAELQRSREPRIVVAFDNTAVSLLVADFQQLLLCVLLTLLTLLR